MLVTGLKSSVSRLSKAITNNQRVDLLKSPKRDTVEISEKVKQVPKRAVNPVIDAISASRSPFASINLNDVTDSCTRYIDYKKPSGTYVKKFKEAETRFKASLNPYTLPVGKFSKETMHICNFMNPHGSIAISSKLNEKISTDGLLQCAAVSFVDRNNNLQTLLHCCPGVSAKSNRVILDYILSCYKDSVPEITIIPGCYEETDSTISFIVDNIKDILGEKCKINFANTAENYSNIILENGELSCSEIPNSGLSKSNPANRIIFNSPLFKLENGALKFLGFDNL